MSRKVLNLRIEFAPPCPGDVHIFDVCGTLFVEDTTLGLLRWHTRRRGQWVRHFVLNLMTARWSPLRLCFMALERVTGNHLAKHLALLTLSGEDVERVNCSAEEYADYLVAKRTIPELFARLEAMRCVGRVILASGSVDPLIRTLCRRWNVEGLSSQLERRHGTYTGRLAEDLTGRKTEALRSLGVEMAKTSAWGYSDNLSDLPLLKECKHQVVVLHRSVHRRRWPLDLAIYVLL